MWKHSEAFGGFVSCVDCLAVSLSCLDEEWSLLSFCQFSFEVETYHELMVCHKSLDDEWRPLKDDKEMVNLLGEGMYYDRLGAARLCSQPNNPFRA